MTYRLIFELVLFLTPFLAFGIWRLATEEAIEEGRKPWPIAVLFGIGAFLAVTAWIVLIFMDRGGREMCYEPRRLVDGEMVGGREVPCEKLKDDLGRAATRDPGGKAHGLGGTDNAGPETAPGPLEPPREVQDDDPQ
ncbi:hypothetical protein [Henriciella aquimarina]|uniref:hypothetical protein n=1 Tax=Henriciella aquimarina TaxID=545261 RepID=UPI0009FEEB87|nr:hypothetical protein [Henriciella aquimarina]